MEKVFTPAEAVSLVLIIAALLALGGAGRKEKMGARTALAFIVGIASFALGLLLRLTMVAVVVVAIGTAPAQAAWGYKRAITISSGTVSSDLSNFPVLVAGTYSWLATVANGGRVQNASGYDVAFFSDSNLTSQLSHETELWTDTSGAVVYWVKIPSITASGDTTFYIAYGDSGISTDQSDADAVWNDTYFQGVWHMNQDPSSTGPVDSTANGYNLTTSGSMDGSDLVGGKVGNALDFDGSNDYAYITDASAANLDITGALTISAWVSHDNAAFGQNEGIAAKYWNYGSYTNQRQYSMVGSSSASGALAAYASSNGSGYVNADGSGSLVNAGWKHVALVYIPSTSLTVYVNGVQNGQNTTSIPSSLFGSSTAIFAVGTQYDPGNANYNWDGKIDEVRVSSTSRAVAWLLAEYNNANDPSAFYGMGTETEHTGGGRRRQVVIGADYTPRLATQMQGGY